MTAPLNLYATKVFSEQPIALWALDDTIDYVALISRNDQDINNWSITGGVVGGISTETLPQKPFASLPINRISEPIGNNNAITLLSPVALDESSISRDLGSVAIGAYFINFDRNINIRIGYSTDSNPDVIRETKLPATRSWAFVSETFSLPADITGFKFIIEASPEEPTNTPYEVAIHGINAGQWAEEFHLESAGVFPQPLPSNIDIDSDGVEALAYGLEGASGYYLSRNNILYAKNSGLPLVYGAFNSTVIFPNTNRPSLIVPGFGAMNESGKYKNFTVEFWTKIQSNSLLPRKIFGPISSTDGLYVEGSFLKLKIGESIGSHHIGSWDRPMLINIRIKPESVNLVINGEEVISLTIDPERLEYPEKFDINDNDQDWLGFYAYEDVPIVQLDCVGIYPYEVATIVSKRRWVYGQGVEVPNNIKGLNYSNSVFIDNTFANRAKTYSYPQMGTWRNGVVENLIPETRALIVPNHTLPSIAFDNQSTLQWYSDLKDEQPLLGSNFLSLKPNNSWENTNGYIGFENLNLLQEETQCFYGAFELTEISENKQVLFQLINEIKGAKLTIALEKETVDIYDGPSYEDYAVTYTFSYKSRTGQTIDQVLYKSLGHEVGKIFLVGLHLKRFASNFGTLISSFFGSKQNVRVFVGGTPEFSNTYSGKIYRIGFSTSRNLQKIESLFSSRGVPVDYENVFDLYGEDSFYDGGVPDTEFWSLELDGGGPPDFEKIEIVPHLASYTLIPKIEFDIFKLDIGIDAYWEDYVPLSYFAKYTTSYANKKSLSLDFLQFNVDYPKLSRFSSDVYDTFGLPIKTYVTFQYLAEGSNSSQSRFTNVVPLTRSGIVRPESDEWLNSKYEVLNDTIIYPPVGINFKALSLNIHIEASIDGIISNPIKIKSVNISSQALGQSPNKIGNRFGSEVYPYKKDGSYFDYKLVNPFSISNNSAPYLYLSGTSGLRMRGEFSPSDNDGITSPINKNLKQFFKVGAFQIAMRYDENIFPAAPVQIFEIQDKNDFIKFYLVSDKATNKRGYIFAINESDGKLNNSVIYNLDGRAVKRPTLSPKSWLTLGLSFTTPLDFSEFVGAFRVTSPIMFDALSFYQITEEDEAERFSYRKWYAVRSEPDNVLDWDYWDESLWSEVLFLSAEADPTILDAGKIYKQYVGTDRLVFNDDYTLNLGNYRYSTFKDVRWSRQILDSA